MTQSSRYILILAGFILFLVAAPVIIMYVRGFTYDFKNNKFVSTGILAVRSDPKSANVYLDGKLKRKNSADLKFLAPREYDLELQKDGYLTWSKRLQVRPGQVTWAGPVGSKIFLFHSNPENRNLAQ